MIREKLAIADTEEWAAQHTDERERIERIGQTRQQQAQRSHLRRREEHAGATDLDRDLELLEGTGVGPQSGPAAVEDEEIAISTPSCRDFCLDVRGDLRGFRISDIPGGDRRRNRESGYTGGDRASP